MNGVPLRTVNARHWVPANVSAGFAPESGINVCFRSAMEVEEKWDGIFPCCRYKKCLFESGCANESMAQAEY